MMKRLLLFCGSAGLLLGSASPPRTPLLEALVRVPIAETCADPASCTTFAAIVPQTAALPAAPLYEAPVEAPAPLETVPEAPPAPPVAKMPPPALAAAPDPSAEARHAPPPEEAEPAEAVPAKPSVPRNGVHVVVSIPQQKAYVFKDGELLDTSPVSTGRKGHATPAGTFPILQKKVRHRSSKYGNAPMPYMQRLTWGGIALHAGPLPGYPASHGCIRLPRSFAKKLYNLTDHGTRVTITRERPKSAKDALKLA